MAIDYTTDGLITSVRNRAVIPGSQNLYPDSRILQIANEEMQMNIVPDIMDAREEYFVYYHDQLLTENNSQYFIPERAIGTKLRDVAIVQNPGESGEVTIPIVRLQPENAMGLPLSGLGFGTTTRPGYIVRNNWIILYGPISAGQTLRMFFFIRPGYLVHTSEAAEVTAINGNIVSCSAVPTTWSTGTIVDVVEGKPPFNYRFIDQTTTLIAGNDITMPDVTDIEVGDWISLQYESPIAQIPWELHPLLTQGVTAYIMHSIDAKQAALEDARYQAMRKNALTMVDNRVEGQGEKIMSNNSISNWTKRGRWFGVGW